VIGEPLGLDQSQISRIYDSIVITSISLVIFIFQLIFLLILAY
jgi:hypothetical protein